ncbi:helix-turn-helix transcriptional regulator [Streptomyces sp. TRM64462]|uniref:helix-turn-helix domain-containing protein n=1 Tax=Streptomyces sp. TRM64462 TaxID=2741726 RepID=UPI001586E1E9|nr:helix-turn-helix transcriptional regulator [Streptomyces sp. TRM64462]
MAIEDNPESRKRYGEELRRRRELAGLTQQALAELAVLSRSLIAHFESGRRRPTLPDAKRLDQALGTDGIFVRFLPTLDGKAVAEHFEEALRLEVLATEIRTYAPNLVPGLLQTRAYASEVLSSGYPPKSDEERDRLLATRLERARILDNFDLPRVWYLLDEAVLRRPIGGPAVMAEQLHHVLDLAERRRRIRVHVLPYSAGAHALLEGFVSLMWFEDLPPVAYVEGLQTGRVLELPSLVQECQALYDHALGDALSHRESLALIKSVAKEYEHAAQL